jgi:carbonic anhydrase
MRPRSVPFVLALLAFSGCSKPAPPNVSAEHPAPKAEHAAGGHGNADEEHAATDKKKRAKKKAKAPAEAPKEAKEQRFSVPFVWETSADDPLARARSHLKEIIGDNARYTKEHGPRFFEGFAEGQKPRSTVLTCADSRLQMRALDATPENDAFVIRNIGNQIENNLGSIEYGVEHLRTSVLLIVGHTGCGAVKAAMGKLDTLSAPIQRELGGLRLTTTGVTSPTNEAWAEAVVENVHNQVNTGLELFKPLVQEGKLTIVGAVFDFRNDLKRGSGKLVIVDVNGNVESNALKAFVMAVSSDGKIVMSNPAAPPAAPAEAVEEEEHEASIVAHDTHH